VIGLVGCKTFVTSCIDRQSLQCDTVSESSHTCSKKCGIDSVQFSWEKSWFRSRSR